MIQWKIAWREMRTHSGRTALTLVSIVVGVGSVLAVSLSTTTARRAFRDTFRAFAGRAELEVISATGQPMSTGLLSIARQVAGVQDAVPLMQRSTIMYYGHGRLKLMAMGIDPSLDAVVRDYELVAGRSLAETRGVLLDASLAQSLNLSVGHPVRLLTRRGRVHARVAGLVRPRSAAAAASGNILFIPLAAAQHYFKSPNQLDRIQIVLADDADTKTVQAALGEQLPQGTLVEPPQTRSDLAEQTMKGTEDGLTMATAFSLLSAVFIITNTFLMSVGQRRRQLAVLRAIGATHRQVAGLIFREAVLLAVIGTCLGIAAGWAGAVVLNSAMSSLFQTSLPTIQLRLLPLMIAASFGLAVSFVGAAVPAYQAAQFTPLEGMSGIASSAHQRRVWLGPLAGAIIILMGIFLLTAPSLGWLRSEASVVGTVVILVGMVLLLPVLLQPLTSFTEAILRPWYRLEGRLAHRQLLRHRIRTTLTIGVLFVALATGLGLASSVLDSVADVRQWYRTVVIGDFFVRGAMPDMGTGMAAAVPDSAGQQLEAIHGVQQIRAARVAAVTVDGARAFLIATGTVWESVASPAQEPMPFAPPAGDQVLVGSVLAQRLQRAAGDSITLRTENGSHRLSIHSVANDYTAGGLTIHMNLGIARRQFGLDGADAYVVKADQNRLPEVEAAIRALCDREGLLLQTNTDTTQMIEGMMAGLVGSLWALMLLGLLVAAIGVVNTLSMNVLEQTREWGLLRTVGMTRTQVRNSIVVQALMLGLLGIVPGLLAGLALAFVLNAVALSSIGRVIEFHFPLGLLTVGFIAAMSMVLLAAWLPAERAARMELTNSLRYD